MHKILKRFLAMAVLACVPLVFSACGGGGGSESTEMTTISGIAMKGPINGALVQVFTLRGDGSTGELLGSGISGNDGTYAILVPKIKSVHPLLVTVSGQAGSTYASESTGSNVSFTSAETFSAVLDTFDTNKKYTVSPLTDAAYQQLQKFLTESPASVADARIVSAANARVATLFNVSDILADPATDPVYAASLKIIDQMIVNSGTATTQQTMALINQAFVDVTSRPYQNYLTSLTSAATAVTTKDPSIAQVVGTVVASAITPPAEPVWTDTTAPNAVANLQAVPGSETATSSVTLFWGVATTTGTNPVAGYDIYRNGSKIASVASTSYIDQPLAQSTTNRYYVVAFDAAGNRAVQSAEITVTTPSAPNLNVTIGGQLSPGVTSLPFKDITAPVAPSNLAATYTAINATTSSVALSWSAAIDNVAVTGYDVYRDGAKIGSTAVSSYTDSSVTLGVVYSYSVAAFDAAGNRSAASSGLSVTPVTPLLGIIVGGQLQ